MKGNHWSLPGLLPEVLINDEFRGHPRIRTAENSIMELDSSGHRRVTLGSLVGRTEHGGLPVAGPQWAETSPLASSSDGERAILT